MKGLLKFVFSVFAVAAAVFGALVVIDQVINKNRIKGDYLECESTEEI
ncbi:MAG: hypothetical protein U0K18_02075 [Acutalibacteraceae bacterium]|nr:hypothetical protein [Clostridia bacterium]MEE1329980.1 hypothetical protein [Acutalibacteraceae bacterium]